MDLETFPNSIIGDKYKILKSIGVGTYGSVYAAQDITTKGVVAVKIENKKSGSKGLAYEANVYKCISDGIRVPPAIYFKINKVQTALVMKLHGPSLKELQKKYG
ncbi:hypothetical protein HZS_4098, partial [Henneguya salminicola]